ncbi:MAG: DUF3303 family protein [Limisphaerales bacterium]
MKRYMVIETFLPECKEKIYERFHAQGRMLPTGLIYLDSWLEHWKDLVSVEVVELGEKPGKYEP